MQAGSGQPGLYKRKGQKMIELVKLNKRGPSTKLAQTMIASSTKAAESETVVHLAFGDSKLRLNLNTHGAKRLIALLARQCVVFDLDYAMPIIVNGHAQLQNQKASDFLRNIANEVERGEKFW